MYGAKVTMRDGKVYENMDLRGSNNGSASGINLMFTARENPMAWLEFNSNDILNIDWSVPLAEASCVIPGLVSTDPATTNQSNKDIQDGDVAKDVTRGVN